MTTQPQLQNALRAVVTVGEGRGFVVEAGQRYVITAAHCLPERPDGQRLPPPHGASFIEERTYPELLAPLGEKPSIWCECLFVDPIADIAVLGPPDNQDLAEQYFAYDAFVRAVTVRAVTPLNIAEPSGKVCTEPGWRGQGSECPAWLLALDKKWFSCTVRYNPNDMLWIYGAAEGIVGGMSGSPIIAEDGSAIGVVCVSSGGTTSHTEGGPNPRLMGNLPGWFLTSLVAKVEDYSSLLAFRLSSDRDGR